jgi:putative tryptophan/tyrosine transport system substrate-binding protein
VPQAVVSRCSNFFRRCATYDLIVGAPMPRITEVFCLYCCFALVTALEICGRPAQAQDRVPVMGYVANYNAAPSRLDIFKKGLEDLGLPEGKNIKIEYRTGRLDRDYFNVIAEFIALKVDIILAANAPATVAAAKSTRSIPIVMAAVNDPVGLGVVMSLEKPGTNVTGTTMYAPQLIGERLKILQQFVPGLDSIGMLLNGNNPNNDAQFRRLEQEAVKLGLRVLALDIRKPEDVAQRFTEARQSGVGALVNGVDSFVNSQRFTMAKLAAQARLPCVYTDYEYVAAGGLMSLGPGHQEGFYGAARYVDAILKGARPADLPIAGPTRFTLSVSRSALANLGLELPEALKARVNEWLP